MQGPPALHALADRCGILPSYVDVEGILHGTSDDTRTALLHAMAIDADDEPAARRQLERLEAEERDRLLDPVAVTAHGRQVMLPLRSRGRATWTAELLLEDGTRRPFRGATAGDDGTIALSEPLPLGYHELRLAVHDDEGTRETSATVIVAPERAVGVDERIGRRRAVGILANLYTLRSAGNWGCGDVGDLRALAGWAGSRGAAFVGINPLHATRNCRHDVSPYAPLSRLFRNPIYLDVPALPETADAPEAAALMADPEWKTARDAARAAPTVDYEGVMRLKRRALEALHRAFVARHRGRPTPRGRAYDDFCAALGEPLTRFARYCALADHMAAPGGRGAVTDWHDWPAPLRDPASTAVADFARANDDAVDLHRYLQFALDQQLAELSRSSRLPLGIYSDLAVGSAADGCDPWAWPGLFAAGATIGAPPDAFATEGQNWGMPPLVPGALRVDRYRYWIRLLRAGFAHAGALRLDHVMGLFRLFWVPAGGSPRDGAYVRYPADELLAIAALESRRHDVVVVGENLGTVPPEVAPTLDRWGMLSSAVVYFERDARGEFLPPEAYPVHALVTAGTHDHVPLAGFWSGRDVEIHRAIGLLPDDAAASRAMAERERTRDALLRRLRVGRPADARPIADPSGFVDAVHSFLATTPAEMVGVALDDLALETDPVNIPGTTNARYPNWQRKMRLAIEDLNGPEPGQLLAAAMDGAEPNI